MLDPLVMSMGSTEQKPWEMEWNVPSVGCPGGSCLGQEWERGAGEPSAALGEGAVEMSVGVCDGFRLYLLMFHFWLHLSISLTRSWL